MISMRACELQAERPPTLPGALLDATCAEGLGDHHMAYLDRVLVAKWSTTYFDQALSLPDKRLQWLPADEGNQSHDGNDGCFGRPEPDEDIQDVHTGDEGIPDDIPDDISDVPLRSRRMNSKTSLLGAKPKAKAMAKVQAKAGAKKVKAEGKAKAGATKVKAEGKAKAGGKAK